MRALLFLFLLGPFFTVGQTVVCPDPSNTECNGNTITGTDIYCDSGCHKKKLIAFNSIECAGDGSCMGSTLEAGGPIICSGDRSCKSAMSLKSGDIITCSGEESCTETEEIDAQSSILCSGKGFEEQMDACRPPFDSDNCIGCCQNITAMTSHKGDIKCTENNSCLGVGVGGEVTIEQGDLICGSQFAACREMAKITVHGNMICGTDDYMCFGVRDAVVYGNMFCVGDDSTCEAMEDITVQGSLVCGGRAGVCRDMKRVSVRGDLTCGGSTEMCKAMEDITVHGSLVCGGEQETCEEMKNVTVRGDLVCAGINTACANATSITVGGDMSCSGNANMCNNMTDIKVHGSLACAGDCNTCEYMKRVFVRGDLSCAAKVYSCTNMTDITVHGSLVCGGDLFACEEMKRVIVRDDLTCTSQGGCRDAQHVDVGGKAVCVARESCRDAEISADDISCLSTGDMFFDPNDDRTDCCGATLDIENKIWLQIQDDCDVDSGTVIGKNPKLVTCKSCSCEIKITGTGDPAAEPIPIDAKPFGEVIVTIYENTFGFELPEEFICTQNGEVCNPTDPKTIDSIDPGNGCKLNTPITCAQPGCCEPPYVYQIKNPERCAGFPLGKKCRNWKCSGDLETYGTPQCSHNGWDVEDVYCGCGDAPDIYYSFDTSHCIGTQAGDYCDEWLCPYGQYPAGRARCSDDGEWLIGSARCEGIPYYYYYEHQVPDYGYGYASGPYGYVNSGRQQAPYQQPQHQRGHIYDGGPHHQKTNYGGTQGYKSYGNAHSYGHVQKGYKN